GGQACESSRAGDVLGGIGAGERQTHRVRATRGAPFTLGETAPYAETLVRFECFLQTFDANDALLTHLLRLRFAATPVAPRLGIVRSEEELRPAPASSPEHPDLVVEPHLCSHMNGLTTYGRGRFHRSRMRRSATGCGRSRGRWTPTPTRDGRRPRARPSGRDGASPRPRAPAPRTRGHSCGPSLPRPTSRGRVRKSRGSFRAEPVRIRTEP